MSELMNKPYLWFEWLDQSTTVMLIAIEIIWNATLVPDPILLPSIKSDDRTYNVIATSMWHTPIDPGTRSKMPDKIGAIAISFVTLEYVFDINPTRNAAVDTGSWSPVIGR